LAAIVVAARHSSRDYEGFDPPTEWLRPFDDQARDALEDPGFWRGRQEASKRCNWHIVTGGLFFVLLVAYSFVSLASVDTSRHQVAPFIVERPLGLGDVFVLLVSAQFLLLTLLSIASIVETVLSGVKRVWKKDWRIVEIGHGWRFIGPFAAATTSLGLTHGAFSGLAKWSGDRLGDCMPHSVVVEAHAKMTGRTARAVRDEIDETVCGSDALSRIQFDVGLGEHLLDDVLGFATLLAVIAIALLGVWHFVNLGTRHVQVPVDSGSSPGGELKGLPNEAWRKKVARFRSIAKIFRRSGVTLLLPSLGFILYGFWKGAWRTYPWWTHLFDQDRLHVSRLQLWEYPLRFEACSSGLQGFGEWLTTACGGFKVEPTWLASFGGWVVGLTVVLVPGLLWAAVRQRSLRKLIGNVWDVLTFWPRWLHPFCVRPYAERAVPELQWRMSELAKHYQPIVISAHSQGSVLAVAALWSLREGLTKRVCLVTYGSPIATLHARFFPAYFGRGQPSNLELLNGRLCHWHNFYRLTDYIGQSLEEADDHDPLPDPPEQPLAEEVGTDPLIFLDEAPLTPWTRFNLHSNYRKETEVKDALKACKNLACSSDLWENDRRHTSQGPSDAEE
jgi:hypothetical protein